MTRMLKISLTAAITACVTSAAIAQADYPIRPVTIVVPGPPAGPTDALARLFAEEFGKAFKQSFIVENRPGANGILGNQNVATAAPDGYRILLSYAASMVINPALYKKLPYDPIKDFAPVAQLGRGGSLLIVRKDLPVNTLQDFVAYAKANPGKISYCSPGSGSGGHLSMAILAKQASMELVHVPYKGAPPCTQDLIGGQVDAAFSDFSSVVEHVKTGRVKALAHSSFARLPALPAVPSLNEAGYTFKNYTWYGFFVPAKTPEVIVNKLNAAITQSLKDPVVIKRLLDLNLSDLPLTTPQQFGQTIQQDLATWSKVVMDVGVQLD